MKKIIPLLLSACFIPSIAQADTLTDARIARLEAQVAQLQNRIIVLERALSNSPNTRLSNNVYLCQIKAFTDTYRAESTNLGIAKREAQRACEKENNPMFCKVEAIHCSTY